MGLEIRPMAAADLAQVSAIAESLPPAPRWPPLTYLKAIDPESMPRRIALVAVGPGPGHIFGFAVASLLPPQAELETIAVSPNHQRQGLARELLHGLIAGLRSAGVQELLLEVRASNHPALALYRSFGFLQAGLRHNYYTEPIEDALLLHRLLT